MQSYEKAFNRRERKRKARVRRKTKPIVLSEFLCVLRLFSAISAVKSFSSVGLRPKFALQFRFYPRPLRIQDAEVNRVTLAAVPSEHVFAKGALFFGAEPKDRLP
jgi:hypothetical protein